MRNVVPSSRSTLPPVARAGGGRLRACRLALPVPPGAALVALLAPAEPADRRRWLLRQLRRERQAAGQPGYDPARHLALAQALRAIDRASP